MSDITVKDLLKAGIVRVVTEATTKYKEEQEALLKSGEAEVNAAFAILRQQWNPETSKAIIRAIGLITNNQIAGEFKEKKNKIPQYAMVTGGNGEVMYFIASPEGDYFLNSSGGFSGTDITNTKPLDLDKIKPHVNALSETQWKSILTHDMFARLLKEALNHPAEQASEFDNEYARQINL